MAARLPSKKIPAEEIRTGDFLPGLDNGYVFEEPEDCRLTGDYNTAFASESLMIGFHTAQGDEAYLICPPDMPVTVEREGGFDDEDEEDGD